MPGAHPNAPILFTVQRAAMMLQPKDFRAISPPSCSMRASTGMPQTSRAVILEANAVLGVHGSPPNHAPPSPLPSTFVRRSRIGSLPASEVRWHTKPPNAFGTSKVCATRAAGCWSSCFTKIIVRSVPAPRATVVHRRRPSILQVTGAQSSRHPVIYKSNSCRRPRFPH